jgi:hypothetical protein
MENEKQNQNWESLAHKDLEDNEVNHCYCEMLFNIFPSLLQNETS